MSGIKLKQTLIEIANKVKPSTTIEEIYQQLALISDIEISEEELEKGKIITHDDLKKASQKWLK